MEPAELALPVMPALPKTLPPSFASLAGMPLLEPLPAQCASLVKPANLQTQLPLHVELATTPLLDIKPVSSVLLAINARPITLLLLDADMMRQLLLEALLALLVGLDLWPQVQRYAGLVTLDGLSLEGKESDASSLLQISLFLQPAFSLPDVPLMKPSLIMELQLVLLVLQVRIVFTPTETWLKSASLATTMTEPLFAAAPAQP